jgi:DNA-binding NarL/FixJ family response regulator
MKGRFIMAKILIIDDSSDFRNVVKNLLDKQFADLEILQATTAEEGFDQVVQEKPELILMDIHLPKMNGLEAARMIKEKVPDCKIILLTMFAKEDVRTLYPNSGIEEFIGKNEFYQKLIPIIRKVLSTKG